MNVRDRLDTLEKRVASSVTRDIDLSRLTDAEISFAAGVAAKIEKHPDFAGISDEELLEFERLLEAARVH